MVRKLLILLFVLFTAGNVLAKGPSRIAKTDRSLWPYPVNSNKAFDFASKMENLVFFEQFLKTENINDEKSLKNYLSLKKISEESVRKWKEQTFKKLLSNIYKACENEKSKIGDIELPVGKGKIIKVVKDLKNNIPDKLKPWYGDAVKFYRYYIYEQMRLAALFPRITSEIMVLDDKEINGFEQNDKSFLFTFDDGPTGKNGNTDKLISLLKNQKIKGVFFVLGSRLKKRMEKESQENLRTLYDDMLLGSHGFVHKSHSRYSGWKKSIEETRFLIEMVDPLSKKLLYFRPPYGQRNRLVTNYVNGNNSKIMLWNIDSQDWNRKISSRETAHRVISLMLLWRRGIILYHDVYSKAQKAVPLINEYFEGSGISLNNQ